MSMEELLDAHQRTGHLPAQGKRSVAELAPAAAPAEGPELRINIAAAERFIFAGLAEDPVVGGKIKAAQKERRADRKKQTSAAQKEALFEAGIPVEICLTSNKITESVASYADHHLGEFLERRHPVSICTDDSGVFETTSAQEHAIAAATFGLSEAELLRLSRAAVNQTFAGAATKARLRPCSTPLR